MYDCDSDLTAFHNDHVTLKRKQQDEMRDRRKANQERLKKGLSKNSEPQPLYHQAQGSYEMRTMIQDANNDYDIDDGAVFDKKDLVGSQGADKSPLDARKMVRDALDDGAFATPPEIRNNCVRVFYQQGYHVDIPVYRELEDGAKELASSEWRGSSPSEVTEWFNTAVILKSPDASNGRQMRRITRHQKAHARSRDSWKSPMPSGLVLSALIDECYVSDDRDDRSLRSTMQSIYDRLLYDLEVKHPVRDEMLTKGPDDASTRFLRAKLREALDALDVLDDSDCKRSDALKAWNKVFAHQFWADRAAAAEENEKQTAKEETAALLRGGNQGLAIAAGIVAATEVTAQRAKPTQAYGGKKTHR